MSKPLEPGAHVSSPDDDGKTTRGRVLRIERWPAEVGKGAVENVYVDWLVPEVTW